MVNVKKRENAQLALVRFLGLGCVSNEPVQKLVQVRISTLLAKYQIIQVFTACQVVKALRAVTFFLLPICKIKLDRKKPFISLLIILGPDIPPMITIKTTKLTSNVVVVVKPNSLKVNKHLSKCI